MGGEVNGWKGRLMFVSMNFLCRLLTDVIGTVSNNRHRFSTLRLSAAIIIISERVSGCASLVVEVLVIIMVVLMEVVWWWMRGSGMQGETEVWTERERDGCREVDKGERD